MARASGWIVLLLALGFGAALLLDLGGLQQRLFDEPAPIAKAPPPPPIVRVAARKPVTPAWFLDAAGFDGAEEEQKGAQAPMLVYFHRRSCDSCRRFEREVLSAAKAQLGNVVKVRVDVDAGEREKKLAARLGVGAAPALALLPVGGTPRQLPLPKTGGELVALCR